MGTTIPVDVAAFLAELGGVVEEMIERYYAESKEDTTLNKSFHHFAPITVQVRTSEGLLAQYMEEGIDIYPEERK